MTQLQRGGLGGQVVAALGEDLYFLQSKKEINPKGNNLDHLKRSYHKGRPRG